MKLGKKPPRLDGRTLRFSEYVDTARLPQVPARVDWEKAVAPHGFPMLANDRVGDCTCAAAAHLIHTWTANLDAHKPVVVDEHAVLREYSRITGYDPARPETDSGAVELDVLNAWRKGGFAGHALYAYASVRPRNHAHVRAAIDLFGGVYVGLALPLTAQEQIVWDVPDLVDGEGAPGSWGGHAVAVLGYGPAGLVCVTWGAIKRMTWGFADAYMDEAYAIVSPDFIDKMGVAPNGFDIAALRADLAAVTR